MSPWAQKATDLLMTAHKTKKIPYFEREELPRLLLCFQWTAPALFLSFQAFESSLLCLHQKESSSGVVGDILACWPVLLSQESWEITHTYKTQTSHYCGSLIRVFKVKTVHFFQLKLSSHDEGQLLRPFFLQLLAPLWHVLSVSFLTTFPSPHFVIYLPFLFHDWIWSFVENESFNWQRSNWWNWLII